MYDPESYGLSSIEEECYGKTSDELNTLAESHISTMLTIIGERELYELTDPKEFQLLRKLKKRCNTLYGIATQQFVIEVFENPSDHTEQEIAEAQKLAWGTKVMKLFHTLTPEEETQKSNTIGLQQALSILPHPSGRIVEIEEFLLMFRRVPGID